MAKYGMLIDVNKCNGCFNCFLACKDEFAGNDYLPYSAAQPLAGQFWMQVVEKDWESAGDYFRTGVAGVDYYRTPKPRWESLHSLQGLVELYVITGNEDYKKAFSSHWTTIMQHDRHPSGGFSTHISIGVFDYFQAPFMYVIHNLPVVRFDIFPVMLRGHYCGVFTREVAGHGDHDTRPPR